MCYAHPYVRTDTYQHKPFYVACFSKEKGGLIGGKNKLLFASYLVSAS
jgi:hypothetical protein